MKNTNRKVWDKKYREANRERRRLTDKLYSEKNKELLKEKKRLYYQKNKEKLKAKTAAYAKANPEKARKWKKESAERHPETRRIGKRRRRAREASVKSERYTTQEVLDLYGFLCHICGKEIDLTAPRQCGKKGWRHGLHIDHLIPISKGGSDTLSNVRPSHGGCNVRKSFKLLGELDEQ